MNSSCKCTRNILRAVGFTRFVTTFSLMVATQSAAASDLPPLFRIGKYTLAGFVDSSARIIVPPRYQGVSASWSDGFLWVVRTAGDKSGGNFMDQRGEEILAEPARPFVDEDIFVAPGFFEGKARIKLKDGLTVFVAREGLLGQAESWDSPLYYRKSGAELSFFSRDGEEVLLLTGDDAIVDSGELIAVRRGPLWGLYNRAGRQVRPVEYDQLRFLPEQNSWFVVASGRCGVLDGKGEWLIAPQFDGVKVWQGHNVAAVLRNDKWKLMSTDKMELVNDTEYDEIGLLGDEIAWTRMADLWRPIAPDGTPVLSSGFHRVSWLRRGTNLWQVEREGRRGLVAVGGEEVLPCVYRSIENVGDGYVIVRQHDHAGLFYAPAARFVLEPLYDRIIYWSQFAGKTAIVVSDKRWGMARLGDERLLLPTEHDHVRRWNMLIEARRGDRRALFDIEGNAVLPWSAGATELPDTYDGFVNGVGKIVCDAEAGLIDEDGKIALACRYEDVGHFSEGLVPARKDGQWGYVNLDGEWVISARYANAHAFLNGLAAVQAHGKYGYIDAQGRTRVPFRYVDAGYAYNDRMPVAREVDGRILWGLIDTAGEIVLPIEYECVEWIALGPEATQFHGTVTWKVY